MEFKYGINGLIPTITQDYTTGEVLMFAYMNEESYNKTVETGVVHYYSRSRQKLWMKGETSGNIQKMKSIAYDCDSDALLILVIQKGPACHTENRSCFYRAAAGEDNYFEFINRLHGRHGQK